jgi:hypothetical protein
VEAERGKTNRLLGYPADARLLIINADDLGMCHSVNTAIFDALQNGIVCSATLMVPCPWALHAMQFLAAHPEIRFGIHLTVISDWVNYRWGPVTPKEMVPSLIERTGYFHNFEGMQGFLAQVDLSELEMEFRSQIEAVFSAGLQPTHLDWHSLRIKDRTDISDVMLKLAREYGLALRVAGEKQIKKVHDLGLPANDHDFLDSYLIDANEKAARYIELLRGLPVGLNEWAVHPGLENAELLTIDPGGAHIRQTDFDFLMSQQAKDVIEEEGIILLDYRVLQEVWKK